MRTIEEREYEVVVNILNSVGISSESVGVSRMSLVDDMDDGGMGSIRFYSASRTSERGKARAIAEAWCDDSDDVPISIGINVDEQGRIYEMDIWKVDFTVAITPPTATRLRDIRKASENGE